MLPLTEKDIRASFVNASRKEVSDMTLPADFDSIDWDSLDLLGWRDTKFARRAYAVIPSLDGDVVGVMFRQSDTVPRSRAQCSWCQDVLLPNSVVFYGAKRVGAAGRNGSTIGTLVCQDFECSRNVRRTPTLAYEGFDVEAARQHRIDTLRLRVAGFADDLLAGR